MVKKKIKIVIQSTEDSFKDAMKFASDFDKGIFKKHIPELSFEDYKTYRKFLTQRRLELLNIIKSRSPENIKKLSYLVHRDFKNVYEDLKILEELGLIKLKKDVHGIKPIALYDEIEINIKIPLSPLNPLRIRA